MLSSILGLFLLLLFLFGCVDAGLGFELSVELRGSKHREGMGVTPRENAVMCAVCRMMQQCVCGCVVVYGDLVWVWDVIGFGKKKTNGRSGLVRCIVQYCIQRVYTCTVFMCTTILCCAVICMWFER